MKSANKKKKGISDELKIQLKYDKINTKYNRLWEQFTNFTLFFFASLMAYAIPYIEYKMENLSASIFISNSILIIVVLLLPIMMMASMLFAFLISVRSELNSLLREHNILL